MSTKRLVVTFLVSWLFFLAGLASAQPTMTLPGAGSSVPLETIRIGSAEQTFEIPLVVTATKEDALMTLDLLCASATSDCRSILGRIAGSNAEFLSSFKLTKIPANGLVRLELKASLPATESYDVVLRLSEGKEKASEMRLRITRDRPVWDTPDTNTAAMQKVKIGPRGIASVRIRANELAYQKPDDISLSLSEFFDVDSNDPGRVRFIDDGTGAPTPSQTLKSADLNAGTYAIKLDATELKPGRSYRGRLQFGAQGDNAPPPLALEIERIAARKPVLVAGKTLGQIETWGKTSIDIQLREKSGSVPIQGLKFDWGTLPAGDDRVTPDIDRFNITLLPGEKEIPLWCGLARKGEDGAGGHCGKVDAANIPAYTTATLRISSECGSCNDIPWLGD